MVCLAALIVFGILGMFSVTHRDMAKEALRCVFRRIRLHPCDPTFSQKVKTKVIWRLSRKNDRLARFLSRRFELFSWLFVAAFLLSTVLFGYGLFNLVKYGSCRPHSDQCVLRPGVTECEGPR